MARTLYLEQAHSARRVFNYQDHPNIARPHPQPIPAIDMDLTGTEVTNTMRYVTLVLPINPGEFNDILEDHIASGIVPTTYHGSRNPYNDNLWIMLHSWPLAEQDRSIATLIYPGTDFEHLMSEGVIPVLVNRFELEPNHLPLCFERWSNFVRAYVGYRLETCNVNTNSPVSVTCRHSTLCITFYPTIHETPVLIQDGNEMYIIPQHAIPGNIITADDEEMEIESANMAQTSTASAVAVRKKDPTLAELGEHGNLINYLPDSGATQHMTARRADLFDEVEGQNLGVEVADGHIIKCSITGKVQLDMLGDNGNPLEAVLQDVMYIPGLSRRLFSITHFAKHGHFATIKKNCTTLYFSAKHAPVTLPAHDGNPMAADIKVTNVNDAMPSNLIPWSRNHDHSSNK
jgi:hypothetical protein